MNQDDVVRYLPWLLSAMAIWMTVMTGNKHRNAWLIGIVNQVLWLVWIIASATWGLLPLNITLWVLYARNHIKWNKS